MSAYDAVKAKYGYREISIATWRDPRQSVHPARGGPKVLPSVSPESASKPFAPYRVKLRPRPPPEPTDDEDSEEEEESKSNVEESPPEPQEVPEEKKEEEAAAEPTEDMPPVIEDSKELEPELSPAADVSSDTPETEALANDEAAVAPPATETSTEEVMLPAADGSVESANADVAVDEDASVAVEAASPADDPLPEPEPLQAANSEDQVEENTLEPLPTSDAQTQESADVEDEPSTASMDQTAEEGGEEASPEATAAEVPPPAPEPPSHTDETASIDEGGEKKVQFAPGTPEPKITQRKKKNAKSSKNKKGRKPHPVSEDQESPDDIVAIVEGPFDEPAPPAPEVIEAEAPKETETEMAEVESVPVPEVAQEEVQTEQAPLVEAIEPASVKVEPARSERSSKKKGKEKGKKKTSKNSKTKTPEAPSLPVPAGLGIDFGDDAPAKPAIVEPAIVEPTEPDVITQQDEVAVATSEAQDSPVDAPALPIGDTLDAQDASPEEETSEATADTTDLDPVAVLEPQPGVDVPEKAAEPDSIAAEEAAKPIESESVSIELVETEPSSQEEVIEAVAPTNVETEVIPKGSTDESESEIVDDDQEEPQAPAEDNSSEVDIAEGVSDGLDDQDSPKLPDSAIDMDEGSAWDEEAVDESDARATTIPNPDKDADEEIKPSEGSAKGEHELPGPLKQLGDPNLDDNKSVEASEIDAEADTTKPTPDDVSNLAPHEDGETSQSESGSPELDVNDEEDDEAVTRERAPSIEQLSNATEVGDDTESDDEDDAYATPHEDEDTSTKDLGSALDEPATAAEDVEEVKSDDATAVPDAIDMAVEDSAKAAEADGKAVAEAQEDPLVDAPKDASDADETSSTAGAAAPGLPAQDHTDPDSPKDTPDPIEPAVDVDAVTQDDPMEDGPPAEDESKVSMEPGDSDMPEDAAVVGEVTHEAEAIVQDIAAGASADEPVEDSPAEAPAVQTEVVETVPEPVQAIAEETRPLTPADADGVAEEPPADEAAVTDVIEPSSNEAEAIVAVPEVQDPTSEELPESATIVGVPAENPIAEPVNEPAEGPPESIEDATPATEEPASLEAAAAVVDSSPPSVEPPSPKLSRSSGRKSKGDRYQTRPSKKHSKDSEKSRDKKSSKDRRERTPEEIAERQRKKDARRLIESSQRLEEERRRFEEEEMKRIRHEVRRAARKAAAAEIERLARKEAETIARREAEKRRSRRVSDVRPRQRGESDFRPRERRESKTSGGIIGLGSGKSETKAGFVRTDSGGLGRERRSRDSEEPRTRRVSPPNDDVFDDVPSRQEEPKSTSHDGSSRRKHRRRTESDRTEPRKRDTGERHNGERREGERRRSSKPEKPKGFFGSLFAKF